LSRFFKIHIQINKPISTDDASTVLAPIYGNHILNYKPVIKIKLNDSHVTFFLSCYSTFLRSELKFLKLPVQTSHYCVTCAHQKSKLQMLWYNHANDYVQFSAVSYCTLSIAYVMLIKMYYNGSL